MSNITVSRRDDDLIAVKRADPAHAARLRAEADLLSEIDHSGVVRLVAFIEGDPAELQTRYVGTETWARTPPTEPDRVVSGLGALAATLADLHDLGICHGALRAEHVVVGVDQRPVLCGFGDAQPFDPTAELGDLTGLARLLRDTARPLGDATRTRLGDLAMRAGSGELTARALAAELASISTEGPTPRRADVGRAALPRVALFTGALIVAGGIVALATRSGADTNGAEISFATVPTSTLAATAPPTSSSSTTTAPPTAEESEPDIEFTHAGRRYGLGRPGDIAVLGDWNCDGTPTPALLQGSKALVSVFDTWPDPDESVLPTATATAPTAIDLETVELDGCDRLRILEPTGSYLFTPEN